MQMLREFHDDVRATFSGKVGLADAVFPPLLFALFDAIGGVRWGAAAGGAAAAAVVAWRLVRHQPVRFAIGGIAGTLLAIGLALRSGRSETYFLPGLLSGAAITIVTVASLVLRMPIAALGSWITRGWPLEWYFHPRVRPAYMTVTALWAVFFGSRTLLQYRLYAAGETATLAVVRVVTGWPALGLLMIASYALGRWQIRRLAGPSVAELRASTPPPWQGQPRGF